MNQQFGEINITKNLEQESIFRKIQRQFGLETSLIKDDNIIILFDDNYITDSHVNYNNEHFKFSNTKVVVNCSIDDYTFDIPKYFFFKNIKMYHYNLSLTQFNDIFNKTKYIKSNLLLNIYHKNTKYVKSKLMLNIYYKNTVDDNIVIAISKIESTDINPRYVFMYDQNIFNKDDVIFLILHLLRPT